MNSLNIEKEINLLTQLKMKSENVDIVVWKTVLPCLINTVYGHNNNNIGSKMKSEKENNKLVKTIFSHKSL